MNRKHTLDQKKAARARRQERKALRQERMFQKFDRAVVVQQVGGAWRHVYRQH